MNKKRKVYQEPESKIITLHTEKFTCATITPYGYGSTEWDPDTFVGQNDGRVGNDEDIAP